MRGCVVRGVPVLLGYTVGTDLACCLDCASLDGVRLAWHAAPVRCADAPLVCSFCLHQFAGPIGASEETLARGERERAAELDAIAWPGEVDEVCDPCTSESCEGCPNRKDAENE